MKLQDFTSSLNESSVPDGLSPYLAALWYEKCGDWNQAHEIVQDLNDPAAAWVHAYLHRVEGDLDNAGYWYRRARRPAASGPLPEEWDAIAAALIDQAEAP